MKEHRILMLFGASAAAVLFALSAAAQSEEAAPQQVAGAASGPTNQPSVRDPFWPVGYTPPPPPPPESEQKIVEAPRPEISRPVEWPALALKGITRDRAGRYMAVLDGIGIAEAGSVVSMTRNGMNYRWRILEISDKGLTSARLECVQIEQAPERNRP
jgi:hypothetical protein